MRVFTPTIAAGGVALLDVGGDKLTVTACNLPAFDCETYPGGERVRLRKGHTYKPAAPFTRLMLTNLQTDSGLVVELQAGFAELQDRGGDASIGGFRSTRFFVALGFQIADALPAEEKAVAVLLNPAGSGRLFLVRRMTVEVTNNTSPYVMLGTMDSVAGFAQGGAPKSLYIGQADSVGEIWTASVAGSPDDHPTPPTGFTPYLNASADAVNPGPWHVTFDSPVIVPPGQNFGAASNEIDGARLNMSVFFEEV